MSGEFETIYYFLSYLEDEDLDTITEIITNLDFRHDYIKKYLKEKGILK